MKNGYDIETFDSAEPYKIRITQIQKFNLHWHSYIEIFYVKKGRILLQTGDFSFHLDEGHICFINANTIHSVNQTDLENQIMILQIPTESGRPFFTLRNYKFNSATYLTDFSKDAAPLEELQTLLENIYKESQLKSAGYNQIILGYINTLLGLMIRRFYLIPKTDDDFTAEKNLARLSDIISYLDEHYTEKLSLRTLADELHINYYYLSHFFKDTAGISFQDYLNNLRVGKSLPLLAEADSSITDVALNSGFPNIKAYTKAFRDKFGILPSIYRRAISPYSENDSINEEKLIHLYSEKITTAEKIASPTELYSKMNLTPKEDRMFSLDYYVSTNQSQKLFNENRLLYVQKDVLLQTPASTLKKICSKLSVKALSVYSPSFTESEKLFLAQKSAFLGIKDFTYKDSVPHSASELSAACSLSMLGATFLAHNFLQSPTLMPACHMELLSEWESLASDNIAFTNSSPFFMSNSYQTAFECFTPIFYVDYFIHKLHGTLIFHTDGCAIYRYEDSYQIFCYHKKSLQMYQSLTDSKDFQKENYLFFVNSFPHMKYSFSFNFVCKKMKQTTYLLSEEHGSVFSEWCRMGAPLTLDSTMTDYLSCITRPEMNVFSPSFLEKPIISVDLPPLGVAYIELTPE